MERRQSPRLEAGYQATLTTLTEPGQTLSVRVEDVSGAGMRLALPERLQPGTPIKINLQDRLLLGEVAWCDLVNGGIQAGVVLEHSVDGLNHLRALVDALAAEAGRVLHGGAR